MPDDSYSPLALAIALTAAFVGLLLHWWWLAILGVVCTGLAMLVWLWPERKLGETAEPADA